MDEEIKKLIKQNAKLTKHIHELAEEINSTTKKIRRFTIISEVIGFIKIFIIVIPIIIGVLYLPPIIKTFINEYKNIFGIGGGVNAGGDVLQNALKSMVENLDAEEINPKELPPEILQILNSR